MAWKILAKTALLTAAVVVVLPAADGERRLAEAEASTSYGGDGAGYCCAIDISCVDSPPCDGIDVLNGDPCEGAERQAQNTNNVFCSEANPSSVLCEHQPNGYDEKGPTWDYCVRTYRCVRTGLSICEAAQTSEGGIFGPDWCNNDSSACGPGYGNG